jgi:NAD(P)-dependent dehydrogenase (short-subunit alcohol dehydrogenase family)
MSSSSFDGKAVLVTGAAGGIGRAAALLFASRGARLFLCDVNAVGLEETATLAQSHGKPVRGDVVDVSNRDAMRAYAELVHGEVEALDVVVNNAGVGVNGAFLDTSLEDWDFIIGVNLWGVIYGCHFFVPPMVRRKAGGHVVNIASAAGFAAPGDMPAYAATKFSVVGFSEALRSELSEHGIGVSAICPGMVNTGITTATRYRGERALRDKDKMVEAFRKRNYAPEKVAEAIAAAVARNKSFVPVGPEAWFLYALKRASPNLAAKLMQAGRDRVGR